MDGKTVCLMPTALCGQSGAELSEDISLVAWVMLPFLLSKLLIPTNSYRFKGRTHGIYSSWFRCGRSRGWVPPVGCSISALHRIREGEVRQEIIAARGNLRLA